VIKLDEAPEIVRIASELKLDWQYRPVDAIVEFCVARIRSWLGDHNPVRTIGELEELVRQRLNLTFEEVWTDEELTAVVKRYAAGGEPVFLTIPDDLDADTYAVLLKLRTVTPRGEEQYVAVIDCRGAKGPRRFFSRWHEIAHLLTMTRQLELPYHRSTDKPPEERLMDHIAGEVGFYDPLFRPALLAHTPHGQTLTFAAVESVRSVFCPEASFQSTLIASAQRLPSPIVYLEAGMGLKAQEKRVQNSRQATFLPPAPPQEKLRALVAVSNAAAKIMGLRINRNMSIPPTSVIATIFRDGTGDIASPKNESLLLWRHSNGKPIGQGQVQIEARRAGDRVYAILQPASPSHQAVP
jgi:hypothetical protein